MALIDWMIVGLFFFSLVAIAFWLNRYSRSVTDFLAANRTAGRYLLTISQSAANFGAISAIGLFELYYRAGFCPLLWTFFLIPIQFLITASGWVIYRYRETRALTLAQFFEMRYSRRFRIFMGTMAFLSGIINYGIFPAVTAHFFLYFCGLPHQIVFWGLNLDTFSLLMAGELGLALFMVMSGGQVTILVIDFIQGQFINIVMVMVLFWLLSIVRWPMMTEVLVKVPADASLINPFHTSGIKDFNVFFYAISAVGLIYSTMAWQGSQGFNASARTPHEARMGGILSQWRSALLVFLPTFIAVSALVVIRHPAFHSVAGQLQAQLSAISEPQLRDQMTVPLALRLVFPMGLMGLFTAMMLSASVSTDSSYLHSWGSIFVQDVVAPLLGRPLDARTHLRILRGAIAGVALFAFIFSELFRQTDQIVLFMAATGAIFLGGAGSVIIGGFYWKKGTTVAAWSSMICGSLIAGFGVIAPSFFPAFPLNGQETYFAAIVVSVTVYGVISLIQNRDFDLDRLLNRGAYHNQLPPEERNQKLPATGWAAFAPGPNFTSRDRLIYWMTLGLQGVLFGGALIVSLAYAWLRFDDTVWLKLWRGFIIFSVVEAVAISIWFLIGGIGDLRRTLHDLWTGTHGGSNEEILSEKSLERSPITAGSKGESIRQV